MVKEFSLALVFVEMIDAVMVLEQEYTCLQRRSHESMTDGRIVALHHVEGKVPSLNHVFENAWTVFDSWNHFLPV